MNDLVVRLSDVRLAREGRRLLDGVTIEVPRGGVVALMGPSGSGKTTILRAVAGLDPFERGTIVVDGITIGSGPAPEATLRSLRRKVGMVFQFHYLFEHLSALKNVWLAPVHAYGARPADAERRALELLEMLGVDHRAAALPRELSGGEAQRVAIARALAVDPPVLLLDEPTASLDADRRAELTRLVSEFVGGDRTIVLATHDEEFARATATRIVHVSAGSIQQET
jgi:ABC-type polar amino acid transport system ATPase subunit